MLPQLLLLIVAYVAGPVIGLMIFYWIIRLGVRHGIEDARRRREIEVRESGYWDPARLGADHGPADR
jgi:hypothetical protein